MAVWLPVSTTAHALAISVSLGVTSVEAEILVVNKIGGQVGVRLPITNARVDAMAMVRTMKNMATARHEEQPGRSGEEVGELSHHYCS